MPDKVVVYAGNRRYYDNIVSAAKSLLFHTVVDRVYFLTEDNVFPGPLPSVIRNVNVSDQSVFHPYGPNISGYYSYMTTLRAGLTKLLPDESVVLWLDPDTIVTDDISGLWSYDLTGSYFAAIEETRNNTHTRHPYYNAGVMLLNLDLMRSSGIDNAIIREINTTHYTHLEQDVLNFLCTGKILPLPSDFNASFVSDYTDSPRIRHYLDRAKPGLQIAQEPYRNVSWEECVENGRRRVVGARVEQERYE